MNYEPGPLFTFFEIFVLCKQVFYTFVCLCTMCMPDNLKSHGARNTDSCQLQHGCKSSRKAVSTAAHCAISPALLFTFHMCSCFCICICMWRPQAFLFFQGLSLISPIWLNWSACLCLSSTRIPWACHHTWLFIISLMRCELIYSYLQGKQHFTS